MGQYHNSMILKYSSFRYVIPSPILTSKRLITNGCISSSSFTKSSNLTSSSLPTHRRGRDDLKINKLKRYSSTLRIHSNEFFKSNTSSCEFSKAISSSANMGTDPVDLENQQEDMDNFLTIHYHRPDNNYEGWGLHVWEDVRNLTTWENPNLPNSKSSFGVMWQVEILPNGKNLSFIIHKGDEKDGFGEILVQNFSSLYIISEISEIFAQEPNLFDIPKGNLFSARAFWISSQTFAFPKIENFNSFFLLSSKNASLELSNNGIKGYDERIELKIDSNGLSSENLEKFPFLENYLALEIPQNLNFSSVVKSQLALEIRDENNKFIDATSIQIQGILDELFKYDKKLGLIFFDNYFTVKVWAPTAQNVNLLVYSHPNKGKEEVKLKMNESNGVWSIDLENNMKGKYYLYEVDVFDYLKNKINKVLCTDPYSTALSSNGIRSMFFDLNAKLFFPPNWKKLHEEKPQLESFNDISIYELHIRDFSASDDTVDYEIKGGYMAFTLENTNGINHLKELSKCGISHIHLLPSFDFASVNENKSGWKNIDFEYLSSLPSDSEIQQNEIVKIQNEDAFNWGYDPVHFGVPEGSYASEPNGPIRTLEFRSMVQSLNRLNFRLILDVVYNHVYASGSSSSYSVLDKIVPGYYLRRNLNGDIENSTCMNNTASEYYMMNKLIIDDVLRWAVDYKVDGFRFDLMGHLMKKTMIGVRDELRKLNIEKDGVDGSKIFLYGEGWDFGEVENNKRGINASQINLYDTEIASFNDRIRDNIIGGSPFSDLFHQGFVTGLYLKPNHVDQGSEEKQKNDLKYKIDIIKIGLAGNLKDYEFENNEKKMVKGSEILLYGHSPVGYVKYPHETINYVSAHDNESLFDIITLKVSEDVNLNDRIRINLLASSMIALSQGIPFFHSGDEILRSKSLDRDSYNSGDWFNKLDFSYESNNFGVGLPPFQKNGEKWDILKTFLSNESLKPKKEEIFFNFSIFKTFISIRYSSPLFRLKSLEEIQSRVQFLNSNADDMPGVIIMCIHDDANYLNSNNENKAFEILDPKFKRIVVVFNAQPNSASLNLPPLKKSNLVLHPIQADGSDEIVKCANFDADSGTMQVPKYTTTVFVENRE